MVEITPDGGATDARRRRVRPIVILVSVVVVAAMLPAVGWVVRTLAPRHLDSQTEPLDDDGGEVHGLPWEAEAPASEPIPDPVWPAAGPITLTSQREPGNALWLGPARGARTAARQQMAAEVLDRAALPESWQDSLVVRLNDASATGTAAPLRGTAAGRAEPAEPTEPTGPAEPEQVALWVEYADFRHAYGGNWAARLKMWQLPECALTTPDRPECTAVPLPSVNDTAAQTVTADVPLTSGSTLVAVAADESGRGGDFGATPLLASSTWSVGGSSGDFTWSYPLRLPPAGHGTPPSIALSYSSSSVDGRSDATNNQPSWIGEGFDYWPGYIERSYVPCIDDKGDGANNSKDNGDLCWRNDNATLNLSGLGSELVYEEGRGWHARVEQGARIEKLTGGNNGDNDGEYWKVTTSDGTQYFFGLNRLPGQSTQTNSTWTVPVFGNHSGEPCHKTSFMDSDCPQAWRWNLDYVVDPYGNTISFWYTKEHNQYAQNGVDANNVSYVRGGTLDRIDYGTWDRGDGDRSVTPTAQVIFTTGDRCLTDCYTGSPATPNKAKWPDVPWDQECKADATSCPKKYSPTFWSTKRLTAITTRVWDTTVTPARWQDVESWELSHSFPHTGDGSTHTGLWLDSIVHKGLVGGVVTMPPVSFTPVALRNRVLTPHNTTNNWHRIDTIVTESGSRIDVDYSLPECSGSAPAEPHTNTKRCYPVIIIDPSDPYQKRLITEWWHKYVVTKVSESDLRLADEHESPPVYTFYEYVGDPAWHYADDNGLTKPNRKTWNQFRGYATVITRTGDVPGQQTLTKTTYLRGMHGDRASPSGGTRTVTVPASEGGETVYDEDQFAGMVREQVVYNGDARRPVSRTVNVPWMSPPTASRTINGDTVTARFVNTRVTYESTALGVDGARGWRTVRTEHKFHDTYGTLEWTQIDGGPEAGDEKCVTYTYNRNLDKNLIETVQRVTTTALACAVAPTRPEHLIADTRYTYDHASSPDTPPVRGTVTRTEQMKDWTPATGTQWQTIAESTVDAFGRRVTATDIRGNTTRTEYTPATGPVTQLTVTAGPYDWVTVRYLPPYWADATMKVIDQNQRVTDVEYDPLGRVSKLWLVGWSKQEHPDTPSAAFRYYFSPDRSAYPYIETTRLNAAGGVDVEYEIVDALLRPRQTQRKAVGGGRIVTDTLYDKRGNVEATYGPHMEPGEPSGTLWWEPEWSVPAVIKTVYDNADRPVAEILLAGDGKSRLVEKRRTTTVYEGDLTKVTPPAGGTPTTTVTDVFGRTVELRQHTTPSGVDGEYTTLRYTYDQRDKLVEVVDPVGNQWTYTYDLRGLLVESSDPDRGVTRTEYNDTLDPVAVTDARGVTLVTIYDELGRRIELREGSETGPVRVQWKYDRLYTGQAVRGQLTEAIRYEPAGSDNAYKWQLRNVTARYQPGGINLVVPAVEGDGLAGTWVFGYGYSAYNGDPTTFTFPAAGGLPGETVTVGYDEQTGLPVRLDTNLPGVGSYVTGQLYTPFGEPTVMTRQVAGGPYVESDNDYDPVDRRLVRQVVQPETGPGTIVDRHYERDPAGNIVAIRDVPEAGGHETQCFRYDTRRRLVAAWTPRAGCEAAPSVADLGGPAPYWLEWTIDAVGNRLSETERTAAGDIVRDYEIPRGGPGAGQPHTLTAVTTTAPGQEAVTTRYAYDSVGNTVCRPAGAAANSCADGTGSQALTWDPEGRLATVAVGGEVVQTNIYDADGTRMIRRDSTGTTLYLPGMELRREAGTVTATRYYTFGSGTIAARTPAGLSWLFGDHQGTQDVAVDAVTQQVTYRRQTPYGGRRGDAAAWPTTKGFVGGTNEPTGLVHIGARQYDPGTGRFLSVDPVMDLTDAQQIHGYAYSNNSPVTFSDPTGLRLCLDNDCRATAIPRPGGGPPKIQDTRYHPSKPQSRGGPGLSPRAQELLSVPILGRPLTEREYWEWRYMYGYKGSTAFTLGDVMAHAECQQRGACLEGVRGGKWFLQAVCEAMGGRPKECWIPSDAAEKFDEIVLAGLGAAPNAYISIPATVLSIIFDVNDGEYQSAAEDAAGLANDVKIKGIKDVGAPIGTMIAQGIEDPEKVTRMLRPGTVLYGLPGGSVQYQPPASAGDNDVWHKWEVKFPMPASFFEIQKSDATLFNDLVQIGMLSPPERLQ